MLYLLAFHAAAIVTVRPHSIDLEALEQGAAGEPLQSGLTDVGMVAVSGIPGYSSLRRSVLRAAHECMDHSEAAEAHKFPDGTTRRTIATHTIPGPGGAQPVAHKSTAPACSKFEATAAPFRKLISEVSAIFASRLSALIDAERPLLQTMDGFEFAAFEDVVHGGEQLEHFHSYTKPLGGGEAEETIATHVDQGLFIAFTPALDVDPREPSEAAGRFYLRTADGALALARFDEDTLVFMLGDGISQLLAHKGVSLGGRLHATPHSLVVTDRAAARSWYGRMFLPPHDAVSPQHGHTFGDVRERMIDASLSKEESDEALALGCSGLHMRANQRELESCAAGTIHCWHRCMNVSEYVAGGQTACDAQPGSATIQCVNTRDQLSTPASHGDYFPSCTATTTVATKLKEDNLTKLEAYPRDAHSCGAHAFHTFADSSGFDHSHLVSVGGGGGAHHRQLSADHGDSNGAGEAEATPHYKFMWSVNGDEVVGKIAYNGLFGWLALGFRNELDTLHNGMNGASVLLAMPGQWVDASTPLDLSAGPQVHEYKIPTYSSSFRTWGGPVASQGLQATSFSSDDCFASVSFTAKQLNGQAFNLDGSDTLIWAANGEDKFMGYHGWMNRGAFTVEWKTGETSEFTAPSPPAAPSPPQAPTDDEGLTAGAIAGIAVGGVAAVGVLGGIGWYLSRRSAAQAAKVAVKAGTRTAA